MDPASDTCWTRVVATPLDWRDRVFGGALVVLSWLVPDPARLPERYRIVVGRHGDDAGVGVAVFRRKRAARKSLQDVERDLASLPGEEFLARYGIDDGDL